MEKLIEDIINHWTVKVDGDYTNCPCEHIVNIDAFKKDLLSILNSKLDLKQKHRDNSLLPKYWEILDKEKREEECLTA